MALTGAVVCDCGSVKTTRAGAHLCPHCDTAACSGHCHLCNNYRDGISSRIIRRYSR